MQAMLNMLMAPSNNYDLIRVLSIVVLVAMALCALFIIIIVVMQPGNSSGVGALGGSTETFLGKNKGKTIESKLRRITVVVSIMFGVLSVAFFVLQLFL